LHITYHYLLNKHLIGYNNAREAKGLDSDIREQLRPEALAFPLSYTVALKTVDMRRCIGTRRLVSRMLFVTAMT
jgi:hypothetical protein